MKKTIALSIHLIIFTVLVYMPCHSQNKASNLLNFLMLYKGQPSQQFRPLSYPNVLSGVVEYDGKRITDPGFKIERTHIFFRNDSIILSDKKLTFMQLCDKGKTITVERLKRDNLLKRIVVDTLGFQVYEPLTFDESFNKREIFFKYNGEFYFVRKSIFRKHDQSIIRTLNKIAFENNEIKKYIIDFLGINPKIKSEKI